MDIKMRLEKRDEQHYVAIGKQIEMKEIPSELPQLIPEIEKWLADRELKPSGVPFFNYLNIQGSRLDAEVGIPVNEKVEGDGHVKPGKFSAGNYAIATFVGPYMNLPNAHSAFEKWLKENNIKITGPRAEFYLNDPDEVQNPEKYITEIVVQIAE